MSERPIRIAGFVLGFLAGLAASVLIGYFLVTP